MMKSLTVRYGETGNVGSHELNTSREAICPASMPSRKNSPPMRVAVGAGRMDDEYRADLARIAGGELPLGVKKVTIDDPPRHGWQRRSELDVQGFEIWELPDGTLAVAISPTDKVRKSPAGSPSD